MKENVDSCLLARVTGPCGLQSITQLLTQGGTCMSLKMYQVNEIK